MSPARRLRRWAGARARWVGSSIAAHRSVVAFVILGVAVTVALVGVQVQVVRACDERDRQWNISRLQILDDAMIARPPEAILRAFPQFRPFYEPGTPLYEAQRETLDRKRDRRLAILGGRPDC